jgi:hypothetical protein
MPTYHCPLTKSSSCHLGNSHYAKDPMTICNSEQRFRLAVARRWLDGSNRANLGSLELRRGAQPRGLRVQSHAQGWNEVTTSTLMVVMMMMMMMMMVESIRSPRPYGTETL